MHVHASALWKTTTMISSVRIDGSTECLAFDCALDRQMFRAYMKDVLPPVLHSGDIVVLDNLSSHKDKMIIDGI
jgi:hypothetical protein